MSPLESILDLVGTLDDAPGEDTARERFRRYLRGSVGTTGAVRDYIEACVRGSGPQYDRALQDLVNHAASLIGFAVEFGRYRGVSNDIGHDGLWQRDDFTIVAEVKTTDAYVIRTATLLGYIDRLISERRIANRDCAMGLYVVARADAGLTQLANAIVAERLTDRLRIATVDTVLSLAELVEDGQIGPDEAVALIRPAGALVGDTVQLLARIASQAAEALPESALPNGADDTRANVEVTAIEVSPASPGRSANPPQSTESLYLLSPVRYEPGKPTKETIRRLLEAGWYVFGEGTAGRKRLKPGDRIAIYESGVGVVAEAEVASRAKRQPPGVDGLVYDSERFPWSFRVTNPRFFFDAPVVIDADLRSRLDAFKDRDPNRHWGLLVQATRSVSEHDFALLTYKSEF